MAKILVADDSAVARLIIAHILHEQSHLVIEADDGRSAQALLKADPGIDLLITDIYMSDMDGTELIAWLRQQPMQSVPAIMMTASGEKGTALQQKTSQASGVLTKPVSTWELLTVISQVLGESA